MVKPRATAAQVVQSHLVNRTPARCAVCNDYIGVLAGVPVILNDKERIVEFVHARCCADKE
jgi:hypothetical protein